MVDPGGITPLFRALGRSDLKCLFFHFPVFVIACVFSLPFVVVFFLLVFFCVCVGVSFFYFLFPSSCTCFEFTSFSPLKKSPLPTPTILKHV